MTDDAGINFLNTDVALVDGTWCVVTLVEGMQHVVSRHASRALADDAVRQRQRAPLPTLTQRA
jgi:hypothetical protein